MEKKLIENPQNNPERKVVEVYPPEKKTMWSICKNVHKNVIVFTYIL